MNINVIYFPYYIKQAYYYIHFIVFRKLKYPTIPGYHLQVTSTFLPA